MISKNNENIKINDPALESVLREKFKKPTAPITGSDMAALIKLEAKSKFIQSLSGLEHAVNLRKLDLAINHIKEITPLRNLVNLRVLNLSCNHITDISPLKSLYNLRILELLGNNISDVTILGTLKSLSYFSIHNNPIRRFFSPSTNHSKVTIETYLITHNIKSEISIVAYDALIDFLDSPTKEATIKALQRSPEILMFVRDELSSTEIETAFKEALSSPTVHQHYVTKFIKSKVLDGQELDFIGAYGSEKAKKIGMEYALKQIA